MSIFQKKCCNFSIVLSWKQWEPSNDPFSGKGREAVSKVTKSQTISEFGNEIYTLNFTKNQKGNW